MPRDAQFFGTARDSGRPVLGTRQGRRGCIACLGRLAFESMAGGRWNPRTTRAVACLALFAAPGCGSQSKAVSRGASDANAPAIVQGDGDANAPTIVQGDASWDQPRTSCPWATSAVTESPSALYLASTGYTGAPPVYEPKGSISAVTSLGACLKAPADAGATGAYEAVFSYVLGGSSQVFVPIGTDNSFLARSGGTRSSRALRLSGRFRGRVRWVADHVARRRFVGHGHRQLAAVRAGGLRPRLLSVRHG